MSLLLPRRGERALPALSGVLLALAYPPLHLVVLPFVGLVPFALWLVRLPADAAGSRAAIRGGIVFGAVYFGLQLYWVWVALAGVSILAMVAWFVPLGILTALVTLAGWLVHHGARRSTLPLWLLLPIAWTGVEWMRAHAPGSFAFPWLGLGTSLTGVPEWVGIAEWVGARGVTFWLALVNGLLATALARAGSGPSSVRLWLALVPVVGLPIAWGVHRADTLVLTEVGRVAVVQPNLSREARADAQTVVDRTLETIEALAGPIASEGVDLLVLPEVALPLVPGSEEDRGATERLRGIARRVGAPILFGAFGASPGGRTNSAFMVDPDGLRPFRYDKRRLVPGVESLPIVSGPWDESRGGGGITAGADWPIARVGAVAAGVLICFESAFASASRAYRLEGADVLVNISNDGWYGRDAWYGRTTGLWQHPAHLVMRAIETRVGVVRAANTGFSLFVDPVGRSYGRTALLEEAVTVESVWTTESPTLYLLWGDWVGTSAAVGTLLLVLSAVARGRRSRSLDPPGQLV